MQALESRQTCTHMHVDPKQETLKVVTHMPACQDNADARTRRKRHQSLTSLNPHSLLPRASAIAAIIVTSHFQLWGHTMSSTCLITDVTKDGLGGRLRRRGENWCLLLTGDKVQMSRPASDDAGLQLHRVAVTTIQGGRGVGATGGSSPTSCMKWCQSCGVLCLSLAGTASAKHEPM